MLKTQYSAENCLEKEKFKSQAQEKQQYAQKNEHDQCVSGEHSGCFNSHKIFKVSDHFQFHLPKLDADKNVWKVNVPKNSNCLFVSVVLAYLIPVKNNDAKFIYRFKKLFPYSESSHVDKEESLKSYNNKLQYVKRLIENYNPFLDAQSIHSDTQWNNLIQEFRNRVKVNDLNIWGTDAQIEQIRKLLKTSDDTIREDLQLPELKLFLDVAGSSESGNNSYYRFCLERNIGNQLFSKIILREFVKYFVEEFEARLNAYHMILKGKANNVKKISDEFTEYLKQAVGGMLGGIIGFFLLSAANGVSLGERFAHLLGNKTDEKYHRKRVVELLDLVYYSEKHKDELRKLLVEAGFDIFQSFEMQFIGMTVESENYQEVLRKLAEDATNRAVNYYAKNGRE